MVRGRDRLILLCLLAFGAGLAGRCGGSTGGPCDGVDCGGHGICFAVADAAFCECVAGWHPAGLECVRNDATNPCLGVDCDGHGTCVLDASRLPGCECEPGYGERSALHCLPLIGDDADADADGEAEAEAEADVCVPNCTGRECGGNGCGGNCGTCSAGDHCNASGQCRCTRDCSGRECGDDGCGGDCGGCPTDYDCDSGSCVLVCHPPDTLPVGGTCLPACGVAGGNHCPDHLCAAGEELDPVGNNCCPPGAPSYDTYDCREGDDRPANNYCCTI
jgi:hypothetical protein